MKMEWLVVKGICGFVHGVASTSHSWKTYACVMAALEAVSRPRYLAFFVIVLYSGMTFGMIMGFLFWHLEDCSSPQIMFSIIPVVRCIADVIVYSVSPHVITKIGVHNLLYLVLASYVVRLTSYVLITNPWCYLVLEVLSGLTSAGGWSPSGYEKKRAIDNKNVFSHEGKSIRRSEKC